MSGSVDGGGVGVGVGRRLECDTDGDGGGVLLGGAVRAGDDGGACGGADDFGAWFFWAIDAGTGRTSR